MQLESWCKGVLIALNTITEIDIANMTWIRHRCRRSKLLPSECSPSISLTILRPIAVAISKFQSDAILRLAYQKKSGFIDALNIIVGIDCGSMTCMQRWFCGFSDSRKIFFETHFETRLMLIEVLSYVWKQLASRFEKTHKFLKSCLMNWGAEVFSNQVLLDYGCRFVWMTWPACSAGFVAFQTAKKKKNHVCKLV